MTSEKKVLHTNCTFFSFHVIKTVCLLIHLTSMVQKCLTNVTTWETQDFSYTCDQTCDPFRITRWAKKVFGSLCWSAFYRPMEKVKKCCECYLLLSARAWPPDIRGAEFCPCHAWGRYPEERLNAVKINAWKAAYTQTFCYNLIKLRQQRASMVYSAFAQTYTFPFSNPTLEGVGHILCHITWCCWLDLSTFLLESFYASVAVFWE